MAPTDVVDIEFTAPFNAAFDSMRTAIKKAVDGFNTLVGRVNDYRWLLGPVAMWWVKKNLETARDVLTKIIDMVQHAFEHQIPVLSLIYTSFKWIDTVKKPISEVSFAITEPDARNQNLYKWTGDAAGAYNAKSTKQKAAADEVVTKAEFISQWLFKIAKANVDTPCSWPRWSPTSPANSCRRSSTGQPSSTFHLRSARSPNPRGTSSRSR
jgi:hypothetical protein